MSAEEKAGGESFAVKMFRSIPLVIERKPALVDWTPAIHLDRTWPDSPNKAGMANCLEMVDAMNRKRLDRAAACVEWFAWLDTQPFMLNEAGTAEDVYFGGHAYPVDIAACVAAEIQREVALASCQRLGRAHVGLCLAGLAPGPGKKVVDLNGDGSAQTVLIGTGKPSSEMSYVVRPGMRTWIRHGKKVGDPFAFTDNHGVSALPRLALGMSVPRKIVATEAAIWNARTKRWPVAAYPAFGLHPEDVAAAIEYRSDLTSAHKMRVVAKWVKPLDQDFRFWRFASGEIVGAMLDTRRSSTDPRTLDAWYSGGETRKASPEDGIRSTNRPCRSWWESDAVATQFADGSGKVLRLPRPQSELAFAVVIDSDKPSAYVDANNDGFEDGLPVTPPNAIPTDPVPPPRRRSRGWL